MWAMSSLTKCLGQGHSAMSELAIGIGCSIVGFLLKHFIDSFSNKDKQNNDELEKIKKELNDLTKSVIRIEGKIELITDNLKPLQRLHKDFSELFGKVRGLEAHVDKRGI